MEYYDMFDEITPTISDLFFMTDKSNYWKFAEVNEYDALDELHDIAVEFCETMGELGYNLSPNDVSDDFLSRI